MENKLQFLIVCENAFLSDTSKNLNLINVFDVINSNNFPTLFPRFAVAFKLSSASKGAHEASLVLSKNKNILVELKMPFTGETIQSIQNFVNFKFLDEGEYNFEVKLDNITVGSTPLFLKKTV